MKHIIQYAVSLLFFILYAPLSATPIILPDVVDISRNGLTQQGETLYVRKRRFTSYLFTELLGGSKKDNVVAEYSKQLEQLGWDKYEYGSSIEFVKVDENNCEILLKFVDKEFASGFVGPEKKTS